MNILKHKELTWVDIEDPQDSDIDYLRTNFNLPDDILGDIIPVSQHSKIEDSSDAFYFVIYLPIFDTKTRLSRNRELDIILSKNFLITSHYEPISPLKDFFDRLNTVEEEKVKFLSGDSAFLFSSFLNIFLKSYFPKLDHINKDIKEIETMIFRGKEKEMVSKISNVQRNLMSFRQSLKPQRLIFESLIALEERIFSKGSKKYFQNVLTVYNKVSEVMENNIEMLDILERTNSSLFSSKLNELIKFFTVISVISIPTALIFSFFGISVPLPWGDKEFDYLVILGAGLIISIALMIYFRKKKWL